MILLQMELYILHDTLDIEQENDQHSDWGRLGGERREGRNTWGRAASCSRHERQTEWEHDSNLARRSLYNGRRNMTDEREGERTLLALYFPPLFEWGDGLDSPTHHWMRKTHLIEYMETSRTSEKSIGEIIQINVNCLDESWWRHCQWRNHRYIRRLRM